MAQKEIDRLLDMVDSTNQQRLQLTELLQSLQEAKSQVTNSALASKQLLEKHFRELRNGICETLDHRLDELVSEVEKIESTSLEPLVESEELIQKNVRIAADIMDEAKSILMTKPEENLEGLQKFNVKAERIAPSNLPEAPSLSSIACISVDLPSHVLSDAVQSISQHGIVMSKPPVHITDVEERPGALLLTWAEIDEDIDVCEFLVQYGSGNLTETENNNGNFCDVYQGPNTSSIVRNLKPNRPYTFRVSCRGDNKGRWSPWSKSVVASTSLHHHEWQNHSEGYYTTVDNMFGTKETPCCPLVLYSKENSYICGHQICFKIIDIGVPDPNDAIGLCISDKQREILGGPGVLCISMLGKVHVEGQEIVNQLPALVKGSTLTIQTELLNQYKVRVTIETGEREITVDWKLKDVESPMISSGGNPFALGGIMKEMIDPPRLYFAMCFINEGWKVSVE
ncbi:cytokine receptor-like factor 3 [Lineus longissimus]|uniref:cytokine receptor-like factor 3 n=1 Tax=Lineus longissimus TaxID=88925 RepID=UPI002B4CD1C0